MAGLYGAFVTGSVSIAGGTPQTVIQIVAPTNQRLLIYHVAISFDGTNSANTPGYAKLERQTGGSFTNTSVAPKKINDPSGTGETLQASAKTAVTSEGTEGDLLWQETIPVFGGLLVMPFGPGQELHVVGGTIFAVKISSAQNVNCYTTILYQE